MDPPGEAYQAASAVIKSSPMPSVLTVGAAEVRTDGGCAAPPDVVRSAAEIASSGPIHVLPGGSR